MEKYYHEFFDRVLDDIEKNNVLKRFEYFDEFYYNVKKIISTQEFKNTGNGYIMNDGREFKFRRTVQKKNSKIHIKSGSICTTVSINNERYHTMIQCKYIVDRDTKNSNKSNSSSDYGTRRSRSSGSSSDDSSYNNPSNPSNPFN